MAAAVKDITASPKSPWYGTYVRKLSVSKECGINVLELYPFSEGNIQTLFQVIMYISVILL